MKRTTGIHHITSIVGHPQENVDFYAGVLGLRLVKKTINFDDPGTYHLYFGNEGGEPGTIITFFPWTDARQGTIGDGQVGVTAYSIPVGAMSYWEERLQSYQIDYGKTERFGEVSLQMKDPHGIQLELVERNEGALNTWDFHGIPEEMAIKGLAGATLYSTHPEETTKTLEDVMGFTKIAENTEMIRFTSTSNIGNVIDIKKSATQRGKMGVGVVHHIAFRATDNTDQRRWQSFVREHGYAVTEVRDRHYFNAIYFQEHGNILFEIATDPPGFAHDESKETMGRTLKLPEQYEAYRDILEETLYPIHIRKL